MRRVAKCLAGECSLVPVCDAHDGDRPHHDGAYIVGRGLYLVVSPLQHTVVADDTRGVGQGLYFVALPLQRTVVADDARVVVRVGALSCCLTLTTDRRG